MQDPENLLSIIYEAFNNDLKGRLRFVEQIHKWQRLGDKIHGKDQGLLPEASDSFHDCKLEDGEMAHEHFHSTKSELTKIMENVYFPVIDCHEHDNLHEKLDVAIKMEHDKM